MKWIVKASVLVVFLVAPTTVGFALPLDNSGGTRCKCYCQTSSSGGGGELDWLKDKSCSSSNGQTCTKSGKPGTLSQCTECRAGTNSSSEWICNSTWSIKPNQIPQGTLTPTSPTTTSPTTPTSPTTR